MIINTMTHYYCNGDNYIGYKKKSFIGSWWCLAASESAVMQQPLTGRIFWNGQGCHVFPQADVSAHPFFSILPFH